MQKLALLFACLACTGHGQNALTPDQQKGFATLLLASNPAAFNALAPVGHYKVAGRGFPQMRGDPKPLAPGTNYPANKKNQMLQTNGFGTWMQSFQTTKGKSKYGMPIFLDNGEINPEYLAAERAEMKRQKTANVKGVESFRKKLVAKKEFELADYARKKIGNVGSNRKFWNTGK